MLIIKFLSLHGILLAIGIALAYLASLYSHVDRQVVFWAYGVILQSIIYASMFYVYRKAVSPNTFEWVYF